MKQMYINSHSRPCSVFLKLQPFLDFENKKLDGDHQMSPEESCGYKLTKHAPSMNKRIQ